MKQIKVRPRRLRINHSLRELVSESQLSANDLIYPVFLSALDQSKEAIHSMPGRYRLGREDYFTHLDELVSKGLKCVCLFPVVADQFKDTKASYSYQKSNFYLDRIKETKDKYPDLLVMTDVALDPYSSDGHDGLVDAKTGKILNDETLEVLNKMSLAQAAAGADILGPSDMMDNRVSSIRSALEQDGFNETLIMSYSAKYASAFYGPFREALDSAPKKGDKKTYQLDFRNAREGIKEALLDEKEGADILMVKPGLAYLDILSSLRSQTRLPLAIYQVSGEFAMIKAAAEKGWINEKQIVYETLTAFKRAGADLILSYFCPEVLDDLN